MISSFKDKVRRFWTWFTGLHWLAIGGLSYWAMLAMQLLVSCLDCSSLDVAAPDQGFFPRYIGGFYPLADGLTMLVSRGLARESSPFPRYFNHPEVVVLDLKPRI